MGQNSQMLHVKGLRETCLESKKSSREQGCLNELGTGH